MAPSALSFPSPIALFSSPPPPPSVDSIGRLVPSLRCARFPSAAASPACRFIREEASKKSLLRCLFASSLTGLIDVLNHPTKQQERAAIPSITIYDTTLRDGAQMVGISLTLADKLKIARTLVELGIHYIEGGWPGSNPKDAEFFLLCKTEVLKNTNTKLAAFGSTRRKNTKCEEDMNIQSMLASGADVITVVAKAWDAQVTRVLETTLEENIRMIFETIQYLKLRNKEVMLDAEHFFDGFSENRDYSLKCLTSAAEAGVDVVVLCDTNGGSMPWVIEEVTREVKNALSQWPHVRLGVHAHNDTDMAVANTLASIRGGATVIQGCINGYGERTGNANLISIIGNLQTKLGINCIPEDALVKLSNIACTIAEIAGLPLSPSQPFVGSNAFAHKGGIHVSALRKMPESYNHINPRIVGNAMHSVVSELAGKGNIMEKAQRAGLNLDHVTAGNVLARIKEMENEGFAFEKAGASVDMLIVRMGKNYVKPFKILEFSVISSNRDVEDMVGRVVSENQMDFYKKKSQVNQAIVKMIVNGQHQISAGEGIGPIDALSHALRDALEAHFPQLERIELTDYSVRLLEPYNARRGTLSTVRVTIDFSDRSGYKWTTVGAHSSIVEASFWALVDGLEFGIAKCLEEGTNT